MPSQFVVRRSGVQFFFNLTAPNNERILTSELYTAKASALNGVEAVRQNAPSDAQYVRLTAKDNRPYFVLLAGNSEVIGTSETYSSTAAMENGINAVKAYAPRAPLEDQS